MRPSVVCATLVALVAATCVWAQQTQRGPDEIIESVKKWQKRDPVIEALTAGDATTPVEWFQVAQILADQERPDLAKDYLKKIIEANLDAAALVKLADRFGPAAFARMASRNELLPEAGQVADAVLGAVRSERGSPEHLAELVRRLGSPDERTRDEATVAIRQAGPAAVAPLVKALGDPVRKSDYARLRRALASLGGEAVRPLLAYLESGDPKLVVQVINALAQLDDRDASLYLLAPYASAESDPAVCRAAGVALERLGPLPPPAEAAGVLARRAGRWLDGQAVLRVDENGQATIWQWDASKKQAVAKRYPAGAARAVLAARLAREALSIAPGDAATGRLYLLAMLEAASYEAGLDEPLGMEPGAPAARAAEFGTETLLAVLDEALRSGHAPAAAAVARILGQTATAGEVLGTGAGPSPLARALRSGDRRTRVAVGEAIVRLRPVEPFAGSSYLTESMAFLATSTGARRAMVAARNTTEARRVGGYLAALGFEVETAVTGSEMIRRLLASADYELVLVDARIDLPPIGILVEQLRHDARTASLPVGILGSEGSYELAERVAREEPMTLALVRPHDQETVRWQVERLEKLGARSAVAPALRKRQAAEILGQLAALAETSKGLFDLGRVQKAALGAARRPELAGDAIGVLARLGTPESQRTLVDLASDRRQSVELRKAALSALTDNVERNGILLTTGEILAQYDRYNQGATADPATLRILGLILDCFEAAGRSQEPGVRGQESGNEDEQSGD